MTTPSPTLAEHLRLSGVPPDLAAVITAAARGCREVAGVLKQAGFSGATGATGETNFQGDAVKRMDLLANETLVETFRDGGEAAVVASEEMEEPLSLPRGAAFAVLFDPLDGSSNVDTGGSVGSIFSILRLESPLKSAPAALLRRGSDLAAAVYVNYGPATSLVFTSGSGSHLFALEPGQGEFRLLQERLRIPERGRVYATNEGQRAYLHPSTLRFLDFLQAPDPAGGRPYSTRYSGCLVSDVHRILLEGGIYFYPADTRDPEKPHGKLRLLYECAPLGMVVEQAGGRASTGRGPIRDIEPTRIHQRVPLYIGSPNEVALAEDFEAGRR